MSPGIVLTAIGKDRVGIVDDISNALLEHRCNIEESRMALLGGEFAIIMLVSGASADLGALEDALPKISDAIGMNLSLTRTSEGPGVEQGRPYRLDCVALDTPGIVHAVTGLLRRASVSIEDLETETTGAPFTGVPLFRMRATCIVPRSASAQDIRHQLDDLAVGNDLDITFRSLPLRD